MGTTGIIASRIGLLLVLVGFGWGLRRRGWLTGATTAQLSRLVVDLAFPCLVVVSLVQSVRWQTLGEDGLSIASGAAVVAISLLLGRLASGLHNASPRTLAFTIGTPNWVFLPLLIADALFGASGVRIIMMMNVGALVVLWTLGVGVLRPRDPNRGAAWRTVLLNPGLIATFLGLTLALAAPGLSSVVAGGGGAGGPIASVIATLFEALQLFGSITVPLALVVTGAQLGASSIDQLGPTRAVGWIAFVRLLLAPAALAAVVAALKVLGVVLSDQLAMLTIIVAAMPVAVSASLFVERFEGDASLASRAVLWTTLAALVTVPAALAVLSP